MNTRRLRIYFVSAILAAIPMASGQLVINEVMQNPSAVVDSAGEWFEIFNPTETAIDIDGWTISDGGADSHVIDNGGPLEVPAGGFLVLANNGDPTTNGGVNADYEYGGGFFLANGDDELILTDLSGTEIDRIEWDGGPIWPDPNGASMFLLDPASDNNDGANWKIDESNTFGDGDTGTPGTANPELAGALAVELDVSSIPEGGFDVITGTVTAPEPVSGDTLVTVTISDLSEASSADAEILDGETEATFFIDSVDDAWPDGDQQVTVTVSGALFDPAEATFTVTDDDTGFLIAINEVYNDIEGLSADANGDGTADDTDEFVEIVNISGGTLDLSGVTLADASFDRHIFPEGTVLDDGASIVVFAGGDIPQGSTAAFGTAEVQIALSNPAFPGLFLDDDGDTLTLIDPLGSLSGIFEGELHAVDLPDRTGATVAESLTSATDLNPETGFVPHTTTSGGAPFSPGTETDGTPLLELTDPLTLAIEPGTRTEADGFVAEAGTVSIPAPLDRDVTVRVDSSDASEIDTAGTSPVVIPAGETSVTIDLNFPDDSLQDGTQVVTLTARASGFLNDTADVDVEDDGDQTPFTGLVINEIDADTEGSDSLEFIELYNTTGEVASLDGLLVVLFNGSNDNSYRTIDLSGFTVPANGFFVIGNPAVANVDLVINPGGSGAIQNGADAVALIQGSAGAIPDGTSVSSFTGLLLDALVYDTSDSDDGELLSALTPEGAQINENENGNKDFESIARVPDGGAAFDTGSYVVQAPTPGVSNVIEGDDDFGTWAAANGISGEPFDGDFDGDGIPNGLEYALAGLDPTSASGSPGTLSGGVLSFTKRAEAAANGDVTYTIEQSTDLGINDPWTAVTPDANDATEISFTLPAGPEVDRVFLRLRVEELGAAF